MCIAQLLDTLIENDVVPLSDIHVIGFSLGAQVAGQIGLFLKSGKLPRLTGEFDIYIYLQAVIMLWWFSDNTWHAGALTSWKYKINKKQCLYCLRVYSDFGIQYMWFTFQIFPLTSNDSLCAWPVKTTLYSIQFQFYNIGVKISKQFKKNYTKWITAPNIIKHTVKIYYNLELIFISNDNLLMLLSEKALKCVCTWIFFSQFKWTVGILAAIW